MQSISGRILAWYVLWRLKINDDSLHESKTHATERITLVEDLYASFYLLVLLVLVLYDPPYSLSVLFPLLLLYLLVYEGSTLDSHDLELI